MSLNIFIGRKDREWGLINRIQIWNTYLKCNNKFLNLETYYFLLITICNTFTHDSLKKQIIFWPALIERQFEKYFTILTLLNKPMTPDFLKSYKVIFGNSGHDSKANRSGF